MTPLDYKLIGIVRGLDHMHDLDIVHGRLETVSSSLRVQHTCHTLTSFCIGKYLGRLRRDPTDHGARVRIHPRSRDIVVGKE